jgi:hypothetical protein
VPFVPGGHGFEKAREIGHQANLVDDEPALLIRFSPGLGRIAERAQTRIIHPLDDRRRPIAFRRLITFGGKRHPVLPADQTGEMHLSTPGQNAAARNPNS